MTRFPIVIQKLQNENKNVHTHSWHSKIKVHSDAPPNSLMDLTASPKVKTMEGKRVEASSLTRNTLEIKGRARTPR